MARRRNKNNMGSAYLVLFSIAMVFLLIIYMGVIKNPTSNIERETQEIKLKLNLDNKL